MTGLRSYYSTNRVAYEEGSVLCSYLSSVNTLRLFFVRRRIRCLLLEVKEVVVEYVYL